jgi:hypothetical protein
MKNLLIKRGGTNILRITILLMGLGVLALFIFALPSAWKGVLVEYPEYPQVVYTFRLIFMGMYITGVPFYFALYQGLKLLSLIDKNTAFSDASINALRSIKFSALLIGLIYLACVPLLYPFADMDDAPGTLLFGLVIACAPIIVSIFASLLQKLLQNALDIKNENDLTV